MLDEDEAHRIIEGTVLPTDPLPIEHKRGTAGLADALGVAKTDSGAEGASPVRRFETLVGQPLAAFEKAWREYALALR